MKNHTNKLSFFTLTFLDITTNFSKYDDNENVTNTPLNLSLNGNGKWRNNEKMICPIYLETIFNKIISFLVDALEPDVIRHATPQLLSLSNSTSVAQLMLTSGQMVQGIQGAQLFVPTSQGGVSTA